MRENLPSIGAVIAALAITIGFSGFAAIIDMSPLPLSFMPGLIFLLLAIALRHS